ncbi:MAG: choice-of-anchor D domain-containing protein, partial [Betaproteobacteria bacterium]|nr:choice-of-anchor D domain-containing protein [Betaproteobacteria bacterium]
MSRPTTRKRTLRPRLLAEPRLSAAALAVALALGGAGAHEALAADCTWNPVTGSWIVAANWSCGNVPAAGDVAIIGLGQTSTMPGGSFLGPTTVDVAGVLSISDNAGLTLLGSNQNSGSITLGSVGNFSELRISGAMSLNGNGTVTTSNTQANRIVAAAGAGDVLTLGSGQSIVGAAAIGAGGAMGLVNNGSIVANLSAGITLNAQGGITNNGVLRADGAVLLIQNSVVTQGAGGVLDAINNGVVRLSGTAVTGGTFTTASGGAIATAGGSFSNSVSGVTNSGTLNIVDNSGLILAGTLTNNGSINFGSVGNFTDLIVSGARSIAGAGTVTLSNSLNNRIRGDNATFSLGSGQTLTGAGTIGAGATNFVFNNAGTVVASQSAGITLNALGGVNNTGTLRADGGTLRLQTTIESAGGQIEARNGSRVELLNGTVINNAAFSATGAGSVITTVSGATVSMGGGTVNGPMTIADNSALQLTADATYNGVLSISSVGNFTDLRLDGARTLGGTATIQMSNSTNNRIRGANASGDSFTTTASTTIEGAATIGAGSAGFVFNNAGTVIASQSAGITINALGGVNNTGTLRADGGTLRLQTTIESAGGQIEARNGSRVELLDGTVINNAAFSAIGAGSVITTISGATVSMGGGTVNGPMTIADNSALRLTADATYNGVLSISSVGNFTELRLDGGRTLGGTATIQMSNSTNNRILGANAGGDSFTSTAGITIQGAATIGAGSPGFVFNNAGTVIASESAGITLNASGGVNNTGTLRADGGTLRLQTTINSGGGQIQARNGSRVELLNGSVINSAAFSATGVGSVITTVSGATVSMGGGIVNGPMTIADNSALRLTADATYSGVLTMASVGNVTQLRLDGARTLDGAATIEMSNQANNRIVAVNAIGDSLTTGVGVTIQGAGSIGAGTNLGLVNFGAIVATQSSGITLSSTGNVGNLNLMRGDGAAFTVTGTTINQGGAGVLSAINGGSVRLTGGASVIGGTLATESGGVVTTVSGNSARLAGVTNTGTLNVVDNSSLVLDGTLTNNGSLNMGSVGNVTTLTTSGNRLIDGSGTITLSNTANNRLVAAVAGDSLTLGANQTLQGAGSIGAGGQLNFTNNGTMIGNVSTALTFSSTGTVTNNNIIRADAGTVTITGTSMAQGALGVIDAINGGIVNLTGNASVSGGTLTSGSGGQIRTVSGNTATIGDLVNAATFNVVDNSSLVLQGVVTNDGALNLGSVGNVTNLRISGDVTLGGSGTTTLSNSGNNRIIANGPGARLTNAAGHTIQGAGAFGNATALDIVNEGTITANQSVALSLLVGVGNTIRNQPGGVMQATPGGTLNLVDPVLNNGTIHANGGLVNAPAGFTGTGTAMTSGTGVLIVGSPSTVGTLANNGTGVNALSLGANSITVSTDYTNANAGVGNLFNRRANVSGAGQILAASNAAQVLSGAGVTGGATPNATLTIGNVRIGATDFAYTIGNGGTTGSTLRGAVQTTVNGANLTDARLSGNGVAATNYNAGAPGGTGETRTVTFTAAGAGTLAALTGQVLNLRSNFDNIADQKLNIVLAGGAAAYNVARGSVGTDPVTVNVANQRILGSATTALTVSNVAPTGAFTEVLNASFGTATGNATNNIAAITGGLGAGGVAAGSSDSSTMRVGVNTAVEGLRTGTQVVNFQSNGTGTSGLGTIGVGSQTVNVQGNVYKVASGQLDTPALNFGVIQVGQSVSPVNLAFTNSATGQAGFVEDLKVTFGSITGSNAGFVSTNGGQMTGILAGQSSTGANGTMTVSVNTANAGVVNAQVGLSYITQGTVGGVSNGLGEAGVGSGSFGVSGTINALIVNQAAAQINNPAITIAARVGDSLASTQRGVSVTNVAGAPPQAGLNAVLSTTNNPPVTATGSFNLLGAGQTNNSSLVVGLASTAAAQNFSNAATTVAFVSDATNQGCLVNCTVDQGSQIVTVTGRVYTPAVASVAPSVNFGIVRVGDVVANRGVSVANSAAVTALNDTLTASIGGTGGAFTNNAGTVNGLIAGAAANNTALTVGLNTAAAGVFNGTASVASTSRNPDMADLSLGSSTVMLTGQVNNLAQAAFQKTSGAGTFTQTAVNAFTLDFGDIAQGASGILTARLAAWNRAPAGEPSDDLKGSYTGADNTVALSFAGFSAF